MKREQRYIVLKKSDVEIALDREQREQLEDICAEVYAFRSSAGKDDLDCVVVEHDWPEYERVWEMIERRVDGETDGTSAPTPENIKRLQAEVRDLQERLGYLRRALREPVAYLFERHPDDLLTPADDVEENTAVRIPFHPAPEGFYAKVDPCRSQRKETP